MGLPSGQACAHNERVQNDQGSVVCPQCGSSAAVHSIQELAALARMRLGDQGTPAAPPPGAAAPQPGWAAEPQPMGQQPGWAAEPKPMGPQPGQPGGPQPGWAAQPKPMGGGGGWSGSSGMSGSSPSDALSSLGDDLAGAAMGAVAGFLGRKIGRRVQDRLEQAMSAAAGKQQDVLRQQIAIAERHPELRACLTDSVVFLAGGSRIQPMPNLSTITVEQSDALVTALRGG